VFSRLYNFCTLRRTKVFGVLHSALGLVFFLYSPLSLKSFSICQFLYRFNCDLFSLLTFAFYVFQIHTAFKVFELNLFFSRVSCVFLFLIIYQLVVLFNAQIGESFLNIYGYFGLLFF